jgi:hypothetical protein
MGAQPLSVDFQGAGAASPLRRKPRPASRGRAHHGEGLAPGRTMACSYRLSGKVAGDAPTPSGSGKLTIPKGEGFALVLK